MLECIKVGMKENDDRQINRIRTIIYIKKHDELKNASSYQDK